MLNAGVVNSGSAVQNTSISVKFSRFWANSCTSKTRLNISATYKLTAVAPSLAPACIIFVRYINGLARAVRLTPH